jgi:hypothetical protein
MGAEGTIYAGLMTTIFLKPSSGKGRRKSDSSLRFACGNHIKRRELGTFADQQNLVRPNPCRASTVRLLTAETPSHRSAASSKPSGEPAEACT